MRTLSFQSCVTAVTMIWDWGMTWKDITVSASYIAFDTTAYLGDDGQGTGSLAVIDSYFEYVPYAITLNTAAISANLLLDNLKTYGCESIVLNSGSNTILAGSSGELDIDQWGLGNWYTSFNGNGSANFTYGYIEPTAVKSESLLTDGAYYARSKPQYESGYTIVNAKDQGIDGDGVTDQTDAINSLLANNVGSVVFFPAGVYIVTDTVKVPVGSLIVGEGWSQIMGEGDNFADETSPHVMVQVGEEGDSGVIEISDVLFTVRGATAGAVLLEWNVHESSQGSAAMWDSHFRVGGATGSDLTVDDCPVTDGEVNKNCMSASLMMHMTENSSGYFENIWAWVADHDLDAALPSGANVTTAADISVYAARGILIESQGPTWFYGSASEHSVLYQYQLVNANDVFFGHMQTETPYFQPAPDALQPFTIGTFTEDPDFEECIGNSSCVESWALRIINSTNAYVYSAGFYSWFSNYDQDICLDIEDCQSNLVDIGYSQGLWIYNIFTKGAANVVTPQGGISAVPQWAVQSGFTTEINVYIAFGLEGADIGGYDDSKGDSTTPATVYIVPLPCTTVAKGSTFTMSAECTSGILALPTSGPDASINNDPSGTPDTCEEICDFWRLLSGTCCGYGGSLGNPVEIPPNVTIPYDIPLPTDYIPTWNITIPIPGGYDPDEVFGTSYWPVTTTTTLVFSSSSSTAAGATVTTVPTTTGVTTGTGTRATGTDGDNPCIQGDCGCYPADTPLQTLEAGVKVGAGNILPGGFCHTHTGGGVVIFPTPISLPEDPICTGDNCRPCQVGVCGDDGESDDGDDDDDCDPDVSTQIGLCDNWNFPLYIPEENTISCDYDAEDAADLISQCQEIADEYPDYTVELIECEDEACPVSKKKRNVLSRQVGANNQATCPPTPPTTKGQLLDGDTTLGCEYTFECNGDWWPNVCNNAASAVSVRGKPKVLTWQGGGRVEKVTEAWYKTHSLDGDKRDDAAGRLARSTGTKYPVGGWGLIGKFFSSFLYPSLRLRVTMSMSSSFPSIAPRDFYLRGQWLGPLHFNPKIKK